MERPEFDDIRPYRDEEIPGAMKRITESRHFPVLASYIFPERDTEELKRLFLSFRTIRDFQLTVMQRANREIIRKSISGFTYSGLEHIGRDRAHLYVSNHRDIMLDAALMNQILVDNGFETSEITFGSNLMKDPLVVDIGKSNKMFKVEREGTPKDFYRNSARLSSYIRHIITGKGESAWIAQRNGRTKDGNDTTDQGLINMFCMSCPEDRPKAISELGIIPVSVSYEWEPCDILKVLELHESMHRQYVKKPGEDIDSIRTGIIQPKGRVHISFCAPLSAREIEAACDRRGSVFNMNIAKLLDSRIRQGYRLFPNNYIAHDIREGSRDWTGFYSEEQEKAFREHMDSLKDYSHCDRDALERIFLGIYANPVDNYLRYKKSSWQ